MFKYLVIGQICIPLFIDARKILLIVLGTVGMAITHFCRGKTKHLPGAYIHIEDIIPS